jgi:hypothetical protein
MNQISQATIYEDLNSISDPTNYHQRIGMTNLLTTFNEPILPGHMILIMANGLISAEAELPMMM